MGVEENIAKELAKNLYVDGVQESIQAKCKRLNVAWTK